MAQIKIPDALKLRLSKVASELGVSADEYAKRILSAALREEAVPQISAMRVSRREQESESQFDRRSDLPSFAKRVLTAARSSRPGQRFGENKVFISDVAAIMRVPRGDLARFKDALVEAHRAGNLSLSRADLVEAMDPTKVETSETIYRSAQYHFVRI